MDFEKNQIDEKNFDLETTKFIIVVIINAFSLCGIIIYHIM
jgi:glutathione peroxidase-family protein